ncbi:MAG: hypothetical protein IT176_12500 [Acidobacteria bacterium]|nr:hypothetical protein [Acidobacteriota bacterium]
MTFDDTLSRALEALNDRLAAGVRVAADEIAGAARGERERIAAERDRIAAERDELATERDRAAADRDRLAALSMPPPGGGPSIGRTLEGVRAIGAAHSLAEVLDTLAAAAAHEASRAAVLLVRGEAITPWRFVGFPQSFDAAPAIHVARHEAGVVAEALAAGAPRCGLNAPLVASLPEGARAMAAPLTVGGQPVAVLYADEGFDGAPDAGWPDRVEILARFGARCLEAITAFRAAQLGRTSADPIRSRAARSVADSSDADAAAHRYARLLVAEIKLYHEPEVVAGRRERDLATRLGAEIARARALYEQRVPPGVGRRHDYFHAELVRTLADGDAALLEIA